MKDLDSEELYQIIKAHIKRQKDNSKKIKKTFSQDYTYTQEDIFCAKKFISFDHNSLHNWISASFESNLNEKKILSPEIKGNWGVGEKNSKRTGIDISNLIFLSNEDINYKFVNNTLKSTFILKGESEFWIFLHSKGKFNDETIVILFTKTEFTETVFMSLGLFINSNNDSNDKNSNKGNDEEREVDNNDCCFRIFHTMQLIKSYNNKNNDNNKYASTDSCLIKIIVNDEGNENIKVSAWINDGDAENQMKGNFYKQVSTKYCENKLIKPCSTFELENKNYKIMIAGSGQYCKITQFSCETSFKEDFDYINGCKQGLNSCNCCFLI